MKTIDEIAFTEKERVILGKIFTAAKEVLPDATVILFGSRARGDAEADSDWDVLVLTEKAGWKTERTVYSALYKVELEEDVIISVLVIERDDWDYKLFDGHPMKKNVEKEGVMVA